MSPEQAFSAIAAALLDCTTASSDERLALLDAMAVVATAAQLPAHAQRLQALVAAMHAADRAQLHFRDLLTTTPQ